MDHWDGKWFPKKPGDPPMNIEITDNQIIDNSLNKYLNKLKTMGILDPSCDDAQVCHIKKILFSFERN